MRARLNGLNAAVVTKLDVLSGFERIGLVTAYKVSGRDAGFASVEDSTLQPVVCYFEGWHEDIGAVRTRIAYPLPRSGILKCCATRSAYRSNTRRSVRSAGSSCDPRLHVSSPSAPRTQSPP